jgi:cob(I)alamin adenosyltransferase
VPRIYTRTGDDGTTGLLYGGRISKSDAATEAYGSVDETVAGLGVARAIAPPALRETLLQLQRELFVVGADLATNPEQREKLTDEVSRVTAGMVERLEALIDGAVERHPLPQEFIVPGSNPLSAALDVARTLCRRAERHAVSLRESGREVSADALHYLNRLSDLLFVLAREAGGEDEAPSRTR